MKYSSKELENIACHIEYLVTDEMRVHAYCPKDYTIDMQVFRLITAYSELLKETNKNGWNKTD